MHHRSEQLQIRITPHEKSALKRRARAAGQDVSAYVLARALPSDAARFTTLIDAVREPPERPFALAELNDALAVLAPIEFAGATEAIDVRSLDPLWQNYVAAMVEHAAHATGARPPTWASDVLPLDEPYFATSLRSLRRYLLRVAPVAFRRRNIFVDATVGDRV